MIKFRKKESKKMEALFNHPFALFFVPSCESTMIEAQNLLKNFFPCSAYEEGAVFTLFQRSGRGRFSDRQWMAKRGQSLLVTFIFNPKRYGAEPQLFPLFAGLALSRYLKRLGVDSQIKWPNDVLVEGKKIAGILCQWNCLQKDEANVSKEAQSEGRILCGIGFNLHQRSFKKEVFRREAISLSLALGKKGNRRLFSVQKVLEGLLFEFALLENEALENAALKEDSRIQEINSLLYNRNELTDFFVGDPKWNQRIRGRFLGISDKGLLRFEMTNPSGSIEIKEFVSGEFF